MVTAAGIINRRSRDDVNKTLEQQLLATKRGLQKTFLTSLPKHVRTALYKTALSLVDSPSGTITLGEYASLTSALDESDLKLIEAMNVFLINSNGVLFHSRLAN